MRFTRGDVVLVEFPFASGQSSKVRPALVVQNDVDNGRLKNTVIAMITSRTSRATSETTQFLIDIETAEGRQTGLLMPSVVNCVNIFTVEQTKLLRVLGRLNQSHMARVDECLKSVLGLA